METRYKVQNGSKQGVFKHWEPISMGGKKKGIVVWEHMTVPSPHHFGGGFCVLGGDVLLQGGLCVAHPPAVRAGEGLGLLHWEVVPSVIQVWDGGRDTADWVYPPSPFGNIDVQYVIGLMLAHRGRGVAHMVIVISYICCGFAICVHGLAEGSTVIILFLGGKLVLVFLHFFKMQTKG